MRKRGFIALFPLLIASLAMVAAGCGGGGGEEGGGGGKVSALPSSSCAQLEKGSEDPDMLIAADFPLQGSSRTQTIQIVGAIRYLLKQANWKAGKYNLAFQSCDDSTAQAGKWDSGKCSQNANNYAQNQSVIAVIGTFNSGCAAIEVPVLNQAAGGAIPIISPANTFVCLTEGGPGCDKTEPDKYYPNGTRNYARVVAHDAYQGAAMGEFAKSIGVKSVYVLNDKEAYGLGVAQNFRHAAEHLGIKIAGFAAWDPKASSYEGLFRKIGTTGADAIFLGGLICENGAKVIKDKVSVLGPNDGKVKLLAPDGFTTQSTIDESGVKNASGMYMSVAGVPIDEFKGKGAQFASAFKSQVLPGLGLKEIDPYAIYGAQAAEILLDAIAKSDGTRKGVLANIYKTDVKNGYLGTFKINKNGDPEGAGAVVGFTIYVAKSKLTTFKTVAPKSADVEAARG